MNHGFQDIQLREEENEEQVEGNNIPVAEDIFQNSQIQNLIRSSAFENLNTEELPDLD